MRKNSKTSLEMPEDHSYMKQKNDQLIKEVVDLKSSQVRLQSDLDYVLREKFIIEQRVNHLERINAEIGVRSKLCGQKVLEVVAELNTIFQLIRSTGDEEDENVNKNSLGNSSIPGTPSPKVTSLGKKIENESRNAGNHQLQDKENMTEETDKSPNLMSNFVSRGGGRLSANPDSFPDLRIDENPQMEGITTLTDWGLPTIEEDAEDSSYNQKEIHGLTLPDISSTTFFTQLPKTNVNIRRREACNMNGENDSSVNVEASSSMEKVDDTTIHDSITSNKVTPQKPSQTTDDTSLKITPKRISSPKSISVVHPPKRNVYMRRGKNLNNSVVTRSSMGRNHEETQETENESTIITPRESPQHAEKSPITLTPKRVSFIKRKSIGSPLPPSMDLRNGNRRKSRSINMRKSLETPVDLQIDEESIINSKTLNMLSIFSKECSSPGFVRSKCDIVKESSLEESTFQQNDSSYMVNWIKNTSTPILPPGDVSSVSMIPKYKEKVSARRKENTDDKLGQLKMRQSKSLSEENQIDHSSVEADVSEEMTGKEKNLSETQIQRTSKPTKEKKISSRTRKEKDSDVEGSLALERKVSSIGGSRTKESKSIMKKSATSFSFQCSEENRSSSVEMENSKRSLRPHSPKKRDTLRRACMNTSYNPVDVYMQAVQREQQWIAENRKRKTLKNTECSKDSSFDNCETKNQKTPSIKRNSQKENADSDHQQNRKTMSDCENLSSNAKNSTSAKGSRKRRADALTDRDENVQNEDREDQEGLTSRKKRAVKKVVYKEPSLIVKLRRN